MEYGSLALFYDITDQEVEAMIQCFRMRRCRFHPGQIICTYGESAGEVGVLVSGEATVPSWSGWRRGACSGSPWPSPPPWGTAWRW